MLALRLISSTRCDSRPHGVPSVSRTNARSRENRSTRGGIEREPQVEGHPQIARGGLPREAAVVHDRDRGERLFQLLNVRDDVLEPRRAIGIGERENLVGDAPLGEKRRHVALGETEAMLERARARSPLQLEPQPRLITN